jgi:glycosyltransferase involved in cell wall biosynthesis
VKKINLKEEAIKNINRFDNFMDNRKKKEEIKLTVIIPIFNKEEIIQEIIINLIESIIIEAEYILIDDASEDKSFDKVKEIILNKNLNAVVVKNKIQLYETMCDNIGIILGKGEYIMEVQSDQYIKDVGFDARMIKNLEKNNFSSISGRGGHAWINLLDPKERIYNIIMKSHDIKLLFEKYSSVGLSGKKLFDKNNIDNKIKEEVYEVDTNMRGPWLTKRKYFEEYGLFDTEKFFLGFDEHEFNLRLNKYGFKSGYIPVKVYSEEKEGSTRIKRTGINQEMYIKYKKEKDGDVELKKRIMGIKSTVCKKIK